MPHPMVLQLRFTRSEFLRAIAKISEEDAQKRVMPMNSISWTVGHLAWQEQRYFIYFPAGKLIIPEIQELYAFGAPPSTPPVSEGEPLGFWMRHKNWPGSANPDATQRTSGAAPVPVFSRRQVTPLVVFSEAGSKVGLSTWRIA